MYTRVFDTLNYSTNRENFLNDDILNLILYNPLDAHEVKMKEILYDYLIKLPQVQFYFITMRPQEKDIYIEDHVMYLNGTDSHVPGAMEKTIRAMEYCCTNNSFKIMIRSNISTIIDFSKLHEEDITRGYMGGNLFVVSHMDPFYGLNSDEFYGIKYIQGTAIILSKECVEYILEHKNEIRMDVIDDISIAEILKHRQVSPMQIGTMVENSDKPALFYRNKVGNRIEDVERMKRIIKNIQEFD